MVSSYLQRPIRIFEQALEDRAWVRRESPKLGPGIPADPAVDRHKPIGVLNRLVAINHGTAADDSHFGGRLPDSPADRSAARIAVKEHWNEQLRSRREKGGRQAIERSKGEGMIARPCHYRCEARVHVETEIRSCALVDPEGRELGAALGIQQKE